LLNLKTEFANKTDDRQFYIFFDNYDDIDELAPTSGESLAYKMQYNKLRAELGVLARRYGQKGLHFVISGLQSSLRNTDEFTRPIYANRYGLALDTDSAESTPLNGRVPVSFKSMDLPPGRGFIVQDGRIFMVQTAAPYADDRTKSADMDRLVESLPKEYAALRKGWSNPIPKARAATEAEAAIRATSEVQAVVGQQAPPRKYTPDEIGKLRHVLAEVMGLSEADLKDTPSEALISMAEARNLTPESTQAPAEAEHEITPEEVAEARQQLVAKNPDMADRINKLSDSDFVERFLRG